MKQLFLRSLAFASIFTSQLQAQIVPSSCNSTDSIKKLYEADASRLSIRHEYRYNDTYVDSVRIRPQLKQTYHEALLAVYNATALPVRDTIVNIYNIHTNGVPGVSNINVVASPTLSWMQQLYQTQPPSSNTLLATLWNRYNLVSTYIQNVNGDLVVIYTPEGMNLPPLVQQLKAEVTIDTVYADQTFNDARDITDTLNGIYVGLTYSIGWGNCSQGCQYRHYWNFKVYRSNCNVEYLGSSGSSIGTGITGLFNKEPLVIFPNPTTDQIHFANLDEQSLVRIYDLQGRLTGELKVADGGAAVLNASDWPKGLYQVVITAGNNKQTARIVVR